ncbi:hypothetical protein EVG20_g5761 [Dentipellis fragilis]|uniref:Uncharacterized protein n=1 Tax=Dentipellis fragilis TaxID=205917 RepID=A0A4Y9YS25_9AGAM|nr:hypothetical protein EVG20_g5761 [Dentipellis fragilis]
MSAVFGGESGYPGYNPPTTAPSTSPRGGKAGSPENNIIHLSPYQPPATPQQAESSKPSHKRKSRKDTTKAPRKASQPAPAPPADDSDQEHAKKKSKTDEEKRLRKALQAQFYRAQHAEAVRHLEDALPEAYKTHDDPPGRETVAQDVKYIKDTPAIRERNVELSRELEQRNLELRIVKKERDDAKGFLRVTRDELNLSKFVIMQREGEIGRLQNRVNYLESMLAGP